MRLVVSSVHQRRFSTSSKVICFLVCFVTIFSENTFSVNSIMALLDPNETFSTLTESLGLDVRLRKAVQRLGHVRPTLVQSKCLPLAITSGRDLLVRAKTGSGKTLGT